MLASGWCTASWNFEPGQAWLQRYARFANRERRWRCSRIKPDLRAYQLGVDVLKLPKERIAFVAFAGWDVAGAKWFGYRTFWNNRQSAAPETLGVAADAAGATLSELLRWLRVSREL